MVDATFLVVDCACSPWPRLCERKLDASDQLVWACTACGAEVSQMSKARWVSAGELDELGYWVDGHVDQKKEEHGGCRGGQCGVKQPVSERS